MNTSKWLDELDDPRNRSLQTFSGVGFRLGEPDMRSRAPPLFVVPPSWDTLGPHERMASFSGIPSRLPPGTPTDASESVDFGDGSANDVDRDALTYTADYILNISGHLQGIRECQTMLRNYSGRLRKGYRAKAEDMLSCNQQLIEDIEDELNRNYDDVKAMEILEFLSGEGVRDVRENWSKFKSKVLPFLDPVPNTSDNCIEISDESGKERGDMEARLFTGKPKRKRPRVSKKAKESELPSRSNM